MFVKIFYKAVLKNRKNVSKFWHFDRRFFMAYPVIEGYKVLPRRFQRVWRVLPGVSGGSGGCFRRVWRVLPGVSGGSGGCSQGSFKGLNRLKVSV